MIITLVNLGKDPVSINGLQLLLGAYETKSVATDGDVKKSTAAELKALHDNGRINYSTAEDTSIPDDFEDAQIAMLHSVVKVQMIDAPNVTGGGTTVTVGFNLTNINDIALGLGALVEMAVFQDIDLSIPAVNATLDTASKGTIVAGAASAALKVKTNSSGEFACTLTDLVDETVYLACSPTFGGPALICLSKDSVTFSA
jgi:hypothetical protein